MKIDKIFLHGSIIIVILISCTSIKKKSSFYLSSGIENIILFPANKKDSLKINSFDLAGKRFSEKCKREKLNCIDDSGIMTLNAEFPKGIYNFRIVLFERFKVPKNAKEGENRVRITIGTQNDLEKVEILRYTDENTKKAIENVFKLKELNTWKSAKIYGIPVKEQFEISIFIN